MAIEVTPPFKEFTDLSGAPLDNGYIYIGTENLNPEVNLISIYWDESFTTPAANPVRTIAGYPSRNGSPGRIFAKSAFSITVKDKNSQLVYYSLSSNNIAQNTTVGTIAALRTTVYSGQPFISVTGYYTAADNIGVREYYWDAVSTEADNGGTIIQVTGVVTGRWKLKYNKYISAKVFGIVGDGITVETSALTNLLTNSEGLTIDFGNLSVLTDNITLATLSNCNIIGNGAVFVLNNPTYASEAFLITIDTISNSKFVGMEFDAKVSLATGNIRNGIWIKQGSNIKFENCIFDECRKGIYCGLSAGVGPSLVIVENCKQSSTLTYTLARADADFSIPTNLITFVYGGADSLVTGCYSYGVGVPIYSEEGKGLKVINNSLLDGWDSQIYIKGERLHISNNRIYNAGKDGIKVVNTGANNAWRSIISNNHVEKFAMKRTDGSVGIHVQGKYHIVSNNTIYLPTHAEAAGTSTLNGIIVGAQQSIISNNDIIGTATDIYQAGIRMWPVQNSVTDILIMGNTISDTKFGVIGQAASPYDILNITIMGNTATRCWGLVYSSGNSTSVSPKAERWSIANNTLISCVADGIFLQNHNLSTVKNNTFISHSGGSPISIDGALLSTVVGNNSDSLSATMITEINAPTYRLKHLNFQGQFPVEPLLIRDNITAPVANLSNTAQIYCDAADGDLKIRFSDGVIKTIVVDT